VEEGVQFSEWVGLAYVFNLIVGTGVLTLPATFDKVGWLLGLIILVAIAFMSYLSMTFVVEVLASSNAINKWRKLHASQTMNDVSHLSSPNPENEEEREIMSSSEHAPLLEQENAIEKEAVSLTDLYTIEDRVEMGQMATLFLNKIDIKIFYLCLVVYLFGDLSIYSAAISKTLRDVTCDHVNQSYCNGSYPYPQELQCWDGFTLTRLHVYLLWLSVFTLCVGPFVFLDIHKTKVLQIVTTTLRSTAFILMIILAINHLSQDQGKGNPSVATLSGIPSLFGASVYSFMCHHSIPSLVTPISNKHNIFRLFAADYILILIFYILVAMTGIFSFAYVHDLYTINFFSDRCDETNDVTNIAFLQYFIVLFPVFTLSTNFPIIGITLRNNLQTIFLKENVQYGVFIRCFLFPVIVIAIPTLIAFATNDLQLLVGVTGSYPGAGVQYIVPALLVFRSRRKLAEEVGDGYKNQHASPFRHPFWVIFVFVWSAICIVFITINFFVT